MLPLSVHRNVKLLDETPIVKAEASADEELKFEDDDLKHQLESSDL